MAPPRLVALNMALSLAQAQWLTRFMRSLPGSHPLSPSEEEYAAAMAAQAEQAAALRGAETSYEEGVYEEGAYDQAPALPDWYE